jgi:hypothetical protein
VQGYSIIAITLTNILHQTTFSLTPSTQEAFEKLKTAMTTTPVLDFPDFSKEYLVETDACDTGIGVVLSQEGHPIAYLCC